MDLWEMLQTPLESDEEWGRYLLAPVDDHCASFITLDALILRLTEVSRVLSPEKVISLVEGDEEFTPLPQWKRQSGYLLAQPPTAHRKSPRQNLQKLGDDHELADSDVTG